MSGIPKGKLLSTGEIVDNNSCFEEVMTVLITAFTFMSTMELMGRRTSPILEFDLETLHKIEFPFAAISENKIYSFNIFDILQKILTRDRIKNIRYKIYEKAFNTISDVPETRIITNEDSFFFIRKAITGSYLIFYEKVKHQIIRRYGANTNDWPQELNFARIIRNAFAHNGVITINNASAVPAVWKNISYSPIQNGRNVFEDFFVVEMIDLMSEMTLFLL